MTKSGGNSGLASASMVIGIIGLVLSFIPLINNIAFFLGVIAVIFGVICLLKKAGNGKVIAGLVMGILAVAITLSMQKSISDGLDEVSKDLDKMAGNSTEEVLRNDASVTLGNLKITKDKYGLTDSEMIVTVKNITKEKKSFSIHIEAVDSNGKRIDDDYVSANDLGAGQSQDFKIFTYIEDSKINDMKSATFKIVKASSY